MRGVVGGEHRLRGWLGCPPAGQQGAGLCRQVCSIAGGIPPAGTAPAARGRPSSAVRSNRCAHLRGTRARGCDQAQHRRPGRDVLRFNGPRLPLTQLALPPLGTELLHQPHVGCPPLRLGEGGSLPSGPIVQGCDLGLQAEDPAALHRHHLQLAGLLVHKAQGIPGVGETGGGKREGGERREGRVVIAE